MAWKAELDEHGYCVNGALALTDSEVEQQTRAIAGAVPIDALFDAEGEMPVIAWDNALEDYLNDRIDYRRSLTKKGVCLWPWVINAELSKDRRKTDVFLWNQGSLPSCTSTAGAHVYQAETLIEIAEGAPIDYDATNPLYTHYGATGGAIGQGLSPGAAARSFNTVGAFLVSEVGADNLRSPSDYRERTKDAARPYAFPVAAFFLLAEAGIPFTIASSQFYNSGTTDKNGVGIGGSVTAGAHSEAFLGAYYEVAGTKYAYVQNSHGDRYGSDKTGRPKSGYWVTEKQTELFIRTGSVYGYGYFLRPRGIPSDRMAFNSGMRLSFPRS